METEHYIGKLILVKLKSPESSFFPIELSTNLPILRITFTIFSSEQILPPSLCASFARCSFSLRSDWSIYFKKFQFFANSNMVSFGIFKNYISSFEYNSKYTSSLSLDSIINLKFNYLLGVVFRVLIETSNWNKDCDNFF